MQLRKFLVLASVLALGACASSAPKRFNVGQAVAPPIVVGNITVAPFKAPGYFDTTCRVAGAITAPDNSSFESYIQKALAEELKAAGLSDDKAAKVGLFGEVKALVFSSTSALTDGWWIIKLHVSSSNGKAAEAGDRYDFKTAMGANTACQETANAYVPAVRKVVRKLVASSEFRELLTP